MARPKQRLPFNGKLIQMRQSNANPYAVVNALWTAQNAVQTDIVDKFLGTNAIMQCSEDTYTGIFHELVDNTSIEKKAIDRAMKPVHVHMEAVSEFVEEMHDFYGCKKSGGLARDLKDLEVGMERTLQDFCAAFGWGWYSKVDFR